MYEKDVYELLSKKAKRILSSNRSSYDKLRDICRLLKENLKHYDWVGFYYVDKQKPAEIVLGPFEGEPTEHVRIPFGKGICGQAAALEKTLMVPDVSRENNYIACSPKVKSEIVVPIFCDGKIVGELDIDSHVSSAFTAKDEAFLSQIAKMVSTLLQQQIQPD